MKINWKSDNIKFQQGSFGFKAGLWGLIFLSQLSCHPNNKKEVEQNSPPDLDGLVQATNQTVFSEVKTIAVNDQSVRPVIDAPGIISYDPSFLNIISARYSGRIESLYVKFNFQLVRRGQRIMDIYSPEILTAQQNLIYLLNNAAQDRNLIDLSKQKLQLLGLNVEQVKQIESSKQLINPIPVYSPYDGHIHDIGISGGISSEGMNNDGENMGKASSPKARIETLPSSGSTSLSIKQGMYVQNGQSIFAVYDIKKVWAVLNVFPQDAALIKTGDSVLITPETNPSNIIHAKVNYIEPLAGQNASAIKIRVYLENMGRPLEIGTLVNARIIPKKAEGFWLPRKSVINLGRDQIVFIKSGDHFITRNIQTGILTDSLIQITSGLKGDEQIAENAQYLVDSESFIKSDHENK